MERSRTPLGAIGAALLLAVLLSPAASAQSAGTAADQPSLSAYKRLRIAS